MSEYRELNILDIVDEIEYFQNQKQEQEKLLDADSEAYANLKSLIAEQRASKGEDEESEKDAEEKIKEYFKTHNDGKENNEYLVRGAELQCSCGSHTRRLNLSPCHGVYIKGHPVVHELDCMAGNKDNITWFGVCSSDDLEAVDIIIRGENGETIRGLKCEPDIVGIWIDSYDGTRIVDNGNKMKDDPEDPVGCNTLTVGSFLVCRHGGIISPLNSGQDQKVEIEEFSEGWSAYKRVMNLDVNESARQSLSILPEKGVIIESNEWIDTLDIPKNATSEQVLKFLKTCSQIQKVSEEIIAFNAQYNNKVFSNLEEGSSLYTENKYIENQGQWGEINFGSYQMSYSGCEIIATYNARLSLGEKMTADDMIKMISDYERKGAIWKGGWGVAPTAIYGYFEECGYDVHLSTDFEMEDINTIGEMYDTIIISVFNDENYIMSQIHTINISKENGQYFVHNNSTSYVAKGPYNNLWEAVMNLSKGNAKPISIIGINQQEESD